MAMPSLDNQTVASRNLSYQRCLIPNLPEDVQHTVRDVTNFVLVPLGMLFAFLSVTSNCLVLTAVIRTKSLQHPSQFLLCSLSITDILWGVFSTVKYFRRFTYKDFCPEGLDNFGQAVTLLCCLSTLSNLAIISKDRHLAVCKPWWYRNHMTRSHVVKHSAVIWFLSFVVTVMATVLYFPAIFIPVAVTIVLLYVISIVVIIYSYVGILIANRRHRHTMNQQGHHVLAALKREEKLANTIGLIIIVLCFTFLPALILPLVLALLGFSNTEKIPFRPLFHFLLNLNGLLNPLLNYGRNEAVRRAVRGLMSCPQCFAIGTAVHPQNTQSSERNQNNPSNIVHNATIDIPLEQRSDPVILVRHMKHS